MADRRYAGPAANHFDGTRFFNPGGPDTRKSIVDLIRWRLSSGRARWPRSVPNLFSDVPPKREPHLRIVHVGHASSLIQTDLCNILVDPHWSERASPLSFAGPRRVNPPGVAFDDLPPIDAVLLTHGHYDHLDLPTLRRLWRAHRPLILAPLGQDAAIRRGDSQIEVATGDWGDRFELSADVSATLTPALHWSARGLRDRNRALWCGFAIRTPQSLVYVVGDTGYGDGAPFRAVRADFGASDVALIPIGAYQPRWFLRAQHVDPAEAVAILRDCGARQGLGVHWGTFRLSDEAWDAPERALAEALAAAAIPPHRFAAMRPGEVWRAETP